MKGLTFWPLYMAPFLIAWYRSRQGKPILGSLLGIFLFNLFLGFTVVAWFLSLANAFNLNPVAWFVLKFFGNQQGRSLGGFNAPAGGNFGSGGAPQPCGACYGAGSTSCSSCGGRGSWYDAPQTATGSSQLRNCGACTSSGRVRCMSCSGSGRAAALI
jgi:hypothetical protein